MQQKVFNILVVFALLILSVNAVQPAFASGLMQEIKAAIAPTTISYQGIVKVDGVPYTGTGYFKFAIVSASGSTSRWSNDGTSSGGSAPTTPVPLPVSDGLFSVRLGDTSLSGMTVTISAQTMYMAGKDSVLRVWFSTRSSGLFTQLSPDRPFSSAPFALVAEYAVEADTLDGYSASDFQQRVSGACTPGSTVQSVNEDGSVTCLPLYPHLSQIITSVDESGDVGWYTSLAIGADGLPLISYYDATNSDLKVAHCNDLACESATLTTLDSDGLVGTSTSITIGTDNLGIISYRDQTNQSLKVAHCSNLECTESTISVLDDSSAYVGYGTSITIGSNGNPIISYRDQTNQSLKVANCNTELCTSATINVIDADMVTGDTSITMSFNGTPLISYYANGDLRVASCNTPNCQLTATIHTLDSTGDVGKYSSITIGRDAYPIISYYDSTNGALKVAHCTSSSCSTSDTYTLDTTDDSGKSTSIIIGVDGHAMIAYHRYESTGYNRIMLAYCSTTVCDTAIKQQSLLISLDYVGLYSSIAIGMDGLPILSFYAEDLRTIHCANTLCNLYNRGR